VNLDVRVRGRRKRLKQLVQACLIVVLVTVLLAVTGRNATGMALPAGYSASQLTFDDQFSGTSLNSAGWVTR
jgi:hypothetical protein